MRLVLRDFSLKFINFRSNLLSHPFDCSYSLTYFVNIIMNIGSYN